MIKSAMSVALVLAFAAPAIPVTAQQSTDVGWARVRTLVPGSEIALTIGSAQPAKRYFVSADDSGLTVLNVTSALLPPAAGRALRRIASTHPDYLDGAAKGGTFLVDDVRLESAGVFVSDRKVADLQQVVETNARRDVAEVRTRRKGRGAWGHLGPLGGYFVGAMTGGFGLGLACQATAGRARCDTGAFLAGMVVGGIAGGAYGFVAANRETEDVVYRAP
jgi:hypothetical protein